MRAWDGPFEQECHRLIVRIVDDSRPDQERDAAWRQLLVQIAPHIEAWAASSAVLRRCGLSGEDEVRGVLVGVLQRMSARRFDNLRAYLTRQPPPEEDESEAALVEGYARLSHLGAPEMTATSGRGESEPEGTPLRGWLRSLTRYAIKDHIKQRFGWTSSVHATYGLDRPRAAPGRGALEQAVRGVAGVVSASLDERTMALAVEYLPGTARPSLIEAAIEGQGYRIAAMPDLRRSKRDLATGAERLDVVTEPGARPPITDALTLSRLLAEVNAFMDTFPGSMREAVRMWLDDASFEEIAAELGLPSAEKGRALVRAGQARLRERFRGQWPALFER